MIVDCWRWATRYQALPGNADPEALPPIFMEAYEVIFMEAYEVIFMEAYEVIFMEAYEAEPLDIGFQAEPGNQLHQLHWISWAI